MKFINEEEIWKDPNDIVTESRMSENSLTLQSIMYVMYKTFFHQLFPVGIP